MQTTFRYPVRTVLAAATFIAATACSNRDSTQASVDSDLARDLSLASSVQQEQPTFKDTSLAPAPVLTREDEQAAEARTRTRPRRPSEPVVSATRRVV